MVERSPRGYQYLSIEELLEVHQVHEASWQAFKVHSWKDRFGRYAVSRDAEAEGARPAGPTQGSDPPAPCSELSTLGSGPALLQRTVRVPTSRGASCVSDDPQNRGIFTTTRKLETGTVVCASAGICALGRSIDALDLYREIVAQAMLPVQKTTFSTLMLERLRSLCPVSDEECDRIGGV